MTFYVNLAEYAAPRYVEISIDRYTVPRSDVSDLMSLSSASWACLDQLGCVV